jgi:hypothetical protein
VTDTADRPTCAVNLNSDRPTCDCAGGTYVGCCKHVESLLALQKAGKVDAVKVPEAKRAPKPAAPAAAGWGDDL